MAHHTVDPFEESYDFDDCCPVCHKTVAIKIDPDDHRFYMPCPKCGHKLLFCSVCWDEIDRNLCDWHKDSEHPCHMCDVCTDWRNHWKL